MLSGECLRSQAISITMPLAVLWRRLFHTQEELQSRASFGLNLSQTSVQKRAAQKA